MLNEGHIMQKCLFERFKSYEKEYVIYFWFIGGEHDCIARKSYVARRGGGRKTQ